MTATVSDKAAWHENLPNLFSVLWTSPSLLVTIGGPILIILVHKLYLLRVFLLGEPSSYAEYALTTEVCALLDHRTQLYTLFVAQGLLAVQFITKTRPRLLKNGTYSTARTWSGIVFIFSTLLILVFVLQGWLMTDSVLDKYRGGGCTSGDSLFPSLPPISSPVTWIRFVVFISAAIITILQMRGENARVEHQEQ